MKPLQVEKWEVCVQTTMSFGVGRSKRVFENWEVLQGVFSEMHQRWAAAPSNLIFSVVDENTARKTSSLVCVHIHRVLPSGEEETCRWLTSQQELKKTCSRQNALLKHYNYTVQCVWGLLCRLVRMREELFSYSELTQVFPKHLFIQAPVFNKKLSFVFV